MDGIVQSRLEMRPMTDADLDEVVAIEIAACPFPWGRGSFRDSLDSGYVCRVFYLDGKPIGYFVVMPVVDEAHLLSISVSPRCQGKGHGSYLLREVFNAARQVGAQMVLLEVRSSNVSALALYHRFGFKQIGRRRDYYPAVGGREDALVLTCGIDEATA